MKILLLATSLLALSVVAPKLSVVWDTTTHNFGDIPHGQPVTHTFTFRNTGIRPLYIDNVRTSCGCTSPDWADVYIPPDSIGRIHVEYDAEDLGAFAKPVKVYFKGQRKAEKLLIEGYVESY
jgi:hypothetical protein